MKIDEWTASIKEATQQLADRDYQERSWFGRGPEVSSPDEMFCRLFDDLDLSAYLASDQLSDLQKRRGKMLKDALECFTKETPSQLDPFRVIHDPDWQKIRRLAEEFAGVL